MSAPVAVLMLLLVAVLAVGGSWLTFIIAVHESQRRATEDQNSRKSHENA